jgi:hypothetical protein
VGKYLHAVKVLGTGWCQHSLTIDSHGEIVVTCPTRAGSDEDRFVRRFLTQALACLESGAAGRLPCRHESVVTEDREQRQHFVCDQDRRPLLRTTYVPAGSERDQLTQDFLQRAVAALQG